MTTPSAVTTVAPAPSPFQDGVIPSALARVPVPVVTTAAVVVGSLAVGVAATLGPMFALVAVFGLLFLLALLVWPKAAVGLLPLAPVLAGLGRGYPIPGLRVSEVLVLLCAGVILTTPRLRLVPWNGLDWCTFGYTICAIAIPVWKAHTDGTLGPGALMTLAGAPLQYFLLYRAAAVAGAVRDLRALMLRVLLVSSILTNIVAIMQSINVPGVRDWVMSVSASDVVGYGAYGFVGRATGLFPHWHVLAGFDVIMSVLAVALLLAGDRTVLQPWGLIVVALFAVVGIAVSVTATSAIGAVVAVVIIGIVGNRLTQILRWGVPVGIGAAIAFWPLIQARTAEQDSGGGGQPQTIAYRVDIWTTQYLPAIRASPVTGYGAQEPERINWQYSESIYFSLLLRGGLVLFAAYLAWTIATLVVTASLSVNDDIDPVELSVARTLLALVLVMVPMQVLFPYLLTGGFSHAVWLLTGLASWSWAAGGFSRGVR